MNFIDFNGAVWSQAAHNILRAGLVGTGGASTGFYFGPLPIPAQGFYLHHPPILHLLLTVLFTVFGEHEWVARLLPISCSILSAGLLWLLVEDCAGARAATFTLGVFASLPMELHYGRMVNFEPLVLVAILGGALCLRYWEGSGNPSWKRAALGIFFLGLWVDWAMYIFVLVLCASWGIRRDRKKYAPLAGVLVACVIVSGALYLLRIRLIQPTAWESLTETFFRRISSHNSIQFTETQWARRIWSVCASHLLWMVWPIAAAGGLYCWRARKRVEGAGWLGWLALVVFAMDCLFVGVFQNDSFIHPYIAYYFVVPLAIAAGLGFERLVIGLQDHLPLRALPRFSAPLLGCALLALTGYAGLAQTSSLRRQFLVLDFHKPEPPDFIPKLGKLIRDNFDPNTPVLCNFLPVYGPQLGYYAQRDLLNNLQDSCAWKRFIQASPKRQLGGLVWLNSDRAREIIAALPAGEKKMMRVGDASFCVWKPSVTLHAKEAPLKKNGQRYHVTQGTSNAEDPQPKT